MTSTRMLAMEHPTVKRVWELVTQLTYVKARLPFLLAVKAEGERMEKAGGRIRNDAALRLFQDSFDMLVIDLDSIRENAIGAFNLLHQHRNILRRFTARDVQTGEDTEFHRFLAETSNKHFDELFPDGEPAKDAGVIDSMIGRFKTDTGATERDRNEARAHRFGRKQKDATASFQTLEEVAEQVNVFENYFRNVMLALTGGYVPMDTVLYHWDWKTTARDLADLIVLGGIEEAVAQYGLLERDIDNRLRFWSRRQQFYESGGRITQ